MNDYPESDLDRRLDHLNDQNLSYSQARDKLDVDDPLGNYTADAIRMRNAAREEYARKNNLSGLNLDPRQAVINEVGGKAVIAASRATEEGTPEL